MKSSIWLVSAAAIAVAAPLSAQDEAGSSEEAAAAQPSDAPADTSAAEQGAGRVFTPDYFAQFAPRNALDMVERIPGFVITGGNNDERGLGQADQNVLVNGERFSSKSDSARDQLRRIPADDVVRIEIVEGNALDIPGLTGQVANVIYESSGLSGQFSWNTGFRLHNTEAQLFGGEASVSGKTGALDYTISISNRNDRFGADGPIVITDGAGNLIEAQDTKSSGGFDNPTLGANLTYRIAPETLANLNLSYGYDWFFSDNTELAVPTLGPVRFQDLRRRSDGPEYEIGGDIEFPLGPGKLKLIGLERFERDNFSNRLVDSFDDGSPATGSIFRQTNESGERIGRFEYGWGMWGADWQVSGEAAFNRLNRVSELMVLEADGEFVDVDFPAGTGGVTEDRFEGILSLTRQLTPRLSLQATAGGEYSKIEQTGVAANSRSFQRPKGSLSLTWKPADDFDVSISARRRVGQLSFGDFLASVSIDDDNANAGNNELVPDQSWNIDIEANKNLGPWGSVKLELRHAWFEDFVDFFPLPGGGEARGNIGDAQRTQVEVNATIKGEPVGINGARIEMRGIKRWMSVDDPFTGLSRPFSQDTIDLFEAEYRHDIPRSDIAYGAGMFTMTNAPYSRRFEIGRQYEGPVFARVFIEHKDVFGLTVRAVAGNILGARNKFERTVFDGSRPDAAILFREAMDRRIGPIFRFSVSGDF
ncbi:TonB-dependent receptor plug domain-containing protein [Qipengyuania nanhaisediminis]|uniref:TonB-dependent receptor plug domain-containing protein n=1 Tax=Qipengyuania nanhaisediminis TaxID=604088 RepID=UPI0038B27A1B